MGRKFNSAFFGCGFLIPGIASAFGLGDITLNSALNQPLNAKIAVSQVGDLGAEEIKSQLASSEAFQKAGVDRDAFLNDIQFKVEVGNNGNATIYLTTQKPVIEPFLNFILEVQWPQGKLIREYTLFLDPPMFSNDSYQPVRSVPVPIKKEVSSRTEVPVKNYVAPARVSSATQAPSSGAQAGNTYGPIARNESLWSIAEKVRPSNELSIHQTMLALQEMNPQAFSQNNINLLKQGAVLRLPSMTDIQQKDLRTSRETVNQQNQSWKKEPPKNKEETKEALESQLGERVEALPEKKVEDSAHLKLIAPTEEAAAAAPSNSVLGSAANKTGSAQNSSATSALTNEKIDKVSLENTELKSRLTEVTEQVKTSEDIVKLKDQQIADLQEKLKVLEAKQATQTAQPLVPNTDGGNANWLDNPAILAGAAAAVIAIVVGLMLLRRKNEGDDTTDELTDVKVEQVLGDNKYTQIASESFAPDFSESAAEAAAEIKEEPVKQELGDVIGESEIYIAYGRFNHAAELLKQGCIAEPDRKDIRLKYLMVLAELGDKDEFITHEQILNSVANESERAELNSLHAKLFGQERSVNNDVAQVAALESTDVVQNEYDAPINVDNELSVDSNTQTDAQQEEHSDLRSDAADEFQFTFDEHNDSVVTESMDSSDDVASLEFESSDSDFSQGFLQENNDSIPTDSSTEENQLINDADFELEFDHEAAAALTESYDASEAVAEPEQDFSMQDFVIEEAEKSSALQEEELNFDFNLDEESQRLMEEAQASGSTDYAEKTNSSVNLDADDLDLLADLDETATKLDLARAYLEMGDSSGARDILNEVISEGNENQKQDAMALLRQIA